MNPLLVSLVWGAVPKKYKDKLSMTGAGLLGLSTVAELGAEVGPFDAVVPFIIEALTSAGMTTAPEYSAMITLALYVVSFIVFLLVPAEKLKSIVSVLKPKPPKNPK